MATMFHTNENTIEAKMHAPERELVIQPIAGKKVLDAGLVDPGIFKGTNKLRAFMNDHGLWFMKYEHGLLPEPLKQQFTSISKLVAFTKDYLGKRNLEVVEVKDIHHGS